MESADYQEIQTLAGFIEKCEEMLKEADELPEKQKSILERLEKCRTRLHLLLAGATLEAIHDRADGINNKIDNLSSQVDESALKFGNFIRERKISIFYTTDYEVILRKVSESILEFEVNLKSINVTPIQFELLCALARKSIEDAEKPSRKQGWMHYDDITAAVSVWSEDTQHPQIRTQISQLRQKLDEKSLNKWLLQNDSGGRYRLSTHPENIIIE